jgi:8-oxo-dGTP pyrophosphatase MutT (NUDIX family)
MAERHRSIVDLHLILRRDDGRILLLRRAGGGYGDGRLHLPSGHLEAGESAVDGVIREAREEVGVTVTPEDLQFVHVMHRSGENGGHDRLGLFWQATRWVGEPYNAEPENCSELLWVDQLPADTIGYPAAGIHRAADGVAFSLYGWNHHSAAVPAD